jgi:hypothetical protein
MSAADERLARIVQWCVPAAVVVVGCGLSLLPHRVTIELIGFVIAWLSLSLPIGVLAGHCMLNESEHR